jgi:hypothetical protein
VQDNHSCPICRERVSAVHGIIGGEAQTRGGVSQELTPGDTREGSPMSGVELADPDPAPLVCEICERPVG